MGYDLFSLFFNLMSIVTKLENIRVIKIASLKWNIPHHYNPVITFQI